MGKLYLITGAAGHLGRTLVQKLLDRGADVRALVLKDEKKIPKGDLEIYYGDVCAPESLEGFFNNPKKKDLVLIHCAGIVSIATRYQPHMCDVNITGTENLLKLSTAHQVKKFIYISSVHALPVKPQGQVMAETRDFDPEKVIGQYAKTKAAATGLVLEAAKKGLDASVVHPSGIIGPYDHGKSHTTALVEDYCHGRLKIGIKGGYDFVDVRDVAEGVIKACEKAKAGDSYLLSNRYYSVKDLLTLLHQVTGKGQVKIYLPYKVIKLVAPLAELYYKFRQQPPLFTPYSIYTLNSNASSPMKKPQRNWGTPREI